MWIFDYLAKSGARYASLSLPPDPYSRDMGIQKAAQRFILALATVILASFSSVPSQALSSNPSPVCVSSTCTISFPYTGDYYAWTVPKAGSFTLELWGGQGGNGVAYTSTSTSTGGLGGYAKGIYTAAQGTVLNIYVGGQGASASGSLYANSTFAGGWNGGGAGNHYGMAGGGGASDIRVGGTALTDRIIVAGGGGGGGNSGSATQLSNGAPGGGLIAPTLETTTQISNRQGGVGGTQSTGFALGIGQSTYGDFLRGAGGGGYYGGYVGGNSTGGGGGSGYVGTLASTSLIAGNQSMPNPSGGFMTGRAGAGFVRITYSDTANSTATLSIAGNVKVIEMRVPVNLTATISDPGRITFFANGKRIAGCISILATTSVVCPYKATVIGNLTLSARLIPTDSNTLPSNSNNLVLAVKKRAGLR